MSYYTELVLAVGIREDKLEEAREALAQAPVYNSIGLNMFLETVEITDTFEFKARGHNFTTDYDPDDEGLVPALSGKWRDFDDIAAWLAKYADDEGRLLVHSEEGDGWDVGYEFDGKGNFRMLALQPIEHWHKKRLPKVVAPAKNPVETKAKKARSAKRKR